jgi:hypothetical protein
MATGENWREAFGPLDPERVALHRRVAEAELRLATLRLEAVRRHRKVSEPVIAEALGVERSDVSRIGRQDGLTLSAVSAYVAALGGRLELRAVFEDETLELLADPLEPEAPS